MAAPTPLKSRKKYVNMSRLAEIFEVSHEAMTQMAQQEGFPPYKQEADEKLFSSREVINWYAGFTDYRKQKARSERFKADLLELEVELKKKEVIKISNALKVWGDLLADLKTNILRIPRIAGNIYPDITTQYELEAELKLEINSLLENLSKPIEITDD